MLVGVQRHDGSPVRNMQIDAEGRLCYPNGSPTGIPPSGLRLGKPHASHTNLSNTGRYPAGLIVGLR